MRVAVLISLILICGGFCVLAQQPSSVARMTVAELRKANPKDLVIVTGCYTSDFEAMLLFACEEAQYLPIAGIWLDTIDSVSIHDPNVLRPKTPINKKQIEFKKGKWGKYNPVVLLGRYQTGGRFGHLDAHSSRFIVHQIMSEGSAKKMPPNALKKPIHVNVRDLIKSPDRFSGRVIEVDGCYISGFEWCDLFPCDDSQVGRIWINLDVASNAKKLKETGSKMRPVLLVGEFGTGGLYGPSGRHSQLLVEKVLFIGDARKFPPHNTDNQ